MDNVMFADRRSQGADHKRLNRLARGRSVKISMPINPCVGAIGQALDSTLQNGSKFSNSVDSQKGATGRKTGLSGGVGCSLTDLEKDLSHTKACVERMDNQVTGLSHDLVQLSADVKTILTLLNSTVNLNEYVHFYRGGQVQHSQQMQAQLLNHKGTKRNTAPMGNCMKQTSGLVQKPFMLESDNESPSSVLASHIRTNNSPDTSSRKCSVDSVHESVSGSTANMSNASFEKQDNPNFQIREKPKLHANLQRVDCYGHDADKNIQSAPSSAGLPPTTNAACAGILSSRSQSCDNVPDTAGEITRRRRLEPVRRGDSARFGVRPSGCGSCLTEECEVVRYSQSGSREVVRHFSDVTSDWGLECSESPLSSSGDSKLSGLDRTTCRLSDFDDVMQQNTAEVINSKPGNCVESIAELVTTRGTSSTRGDSGIDMGKETNLQTKNSMLLTTDL